MCVHDVVHGVYLFEKTSNEYQHPDFVFENSYHKCSKNRKDLCNNVVMYPKDAGKMETSVDL